MASCRGCDGTATIDIGEMVSVVLKPNQGALTILTIGGKLTRIAPGQVVDIPKINADQYAAHLERSV